ncbi:restriction endonuclease subunit S [Bacteroidota bacterium]
MNSNNIKLGELFIERGDSINPKNYPDETFELYSIPSYDNQIPEILLGSAIGSTKKCLEEYDVLLSKIVPHIRRCWIVGTNSGYRQIGSSEWITFRSEKFDPDYLRYFLLSDDFNKKYLGTIKGVGGSLMRADPKQVAQFNIPLPPLETQKQIAAILKKAEMIRQNDKIIIDKYDQLAQSVFNEMFGNEQGNNMTLDEVSDKSSKGTFSNGPFGSDLLTSELTTSGVPVIYIRDIRHGEFNWVSNVFVTKEKANNLQNCQVIPGDLLIAKVGDPPGIAAIYPKNRGLAIITQDVIRFRSNPNITNSEYLKFWFNSHIGQYHLNPIIVDGTRKRFGLGDLKKTKIMVPHINLQNRFTNIITHLEYQKNLSHRSLLKSDMLFRSLIQRAFNGELLFGT